MKSLESKMGKRNRFLSDVKDVAQRYMLDYLLITHRADVYQNPNGSFAVYQGRQNQVERDYRCCDMSSFDVPKDKSDPKRYLLIAHNLFEHMRGYQFDYELEDMDYQGWTYQNAKDMAKYRKGVCIDFTTAAALQLYLNKLDGHAKHYMCMINNPTKGMVMHSITIIHDGNMSRYYFVENAMDCLRGIWAASRLDEILNLVKDALGTHLCHTAPEMLVYPYDPLEECLPGNTQSGIINIFKQRIPIHWNENFYQVNKLR